MYQVIAKYKLGRTANVLFSGSMVECTQWQANHPNENCLIREYMIGC